MPTERIPVSRHRRHRLTWWQQLDLDYGPDDHRPGFRDEDERRAAWIRHRGWLMERCRHGWRPEAWWEFEAPIPRPDDNDYEKAVLWEANLLTPEERAELEAEWREDFEAAQRPDFWLCVGPGEHLTGAAARHAHFADRGIPRALIKRWRAERRRRAKTIHKLAEPDPA